MTDGDIELASTPEAKRRKGPVQQTRASAWESGYGSAEAPLKRSKIERRHSVTNEALDVVIN